MTIYIKKEKDSVNNYIAFLKPTDPFLSDTCFSISFINDIRGLIGLSYFIDMIKFGFKPEKIKLEIYDKYKCDDFFYIHDIINKIEEL